MAAVDLSVTKRWSHFCYHCFAKVPYNRNANEWLMNHAIFGCKGPKARDEFGNEEPAQLIAMWHQHIDFRVWRGSFWTADLDIPPLP